DHSVGAVTHQWFFGDGQTSTEQHPKHQYAKPCIYDVKLVITNDECTHSTQQTVQVIDEAANFIADATEICKGSNINLSSININEANIQNWSWDFGDGTKSSVVNNVNHTYKTSGNFQVTLTVTDLLGCTNSYSLPVN